MSDVARHLGAKVLCGRDKLALNMDTAFSSDLMSDVLAHVDSNCLLLTGLANEHVIRTADMVDIQCVVFVRGKVIQEDIVEMAKKRGIVVMCCDKSLYESSGVLYQQGLSAIGMGSD
ncbi:hypothetical protein LJB83_00815 [Clostridia bacterium OttesenSCG-928-F22]|nr:hypothetical protein [Clostridia bacterium OttesenSCG-928-F22]